MRVEICKQTFLSHFRSAAKMSIEIECFQQICRYCLASLDSGETIECLSDILADRDLTFIIQTCIEPEVSAAVILRIRDDLNFVFSLLGKCQTRITTKYLRPMHGHITRIQWISHEMQEITGFSTCGPSE